MAENPFESPESPQPSRRRGWFPLSSTTIFLTQAMVTVGYNILGVSEVNPAFHWARPFLPLVYIYPVVLAFPILLSTAARREGRSADANLMLVILSFVMIGCAILGMIPLVQ